MDTRLGRMLSSICTMAVMIGTCTGLWAAVNFYLVYSCGHVSRGFEMLFKDYLEIRRYLTNDVLLFRDRAALLSLSQTGLLMLVTLNALSLTWNTFKIRRNRERLKPKRMLDQIAIFSMAVIGTAVALYVFHKLATLYYSPVELGFDIAWLDGDVHRSLDGVIKPDILTVIISIAAQFGSLILALLLQEARILNMKCSVVLGFGLSFLALYVYTAHSNAMEPFLSQYTVTLHLPMALVSFFLILGFLYLPVLAANLALSFALKMLTEEDRLLSLKIAALRGWLRERV